MKMDRHGDVVMDNGVLNYVLHTHFSDDEVHPRKSAIVELYIVSEPQKINKLEVEEETFRLLKKNFNKSIFAF